jgi:hypothetical protein
MAFVVLTPNGLRSIPTSPTTPNVDYVPAVSGSNTITLTAAGMDVTAPYLKCTGDIQADRYLSSDGSAGLTTTQTFKDSAGTDKTMTIKDGLITDIS